MYWPVSAPRVYATSSSRISSAQIIRTNETPDEEGSYLNISRTTEQSTHDGDESPGLPPTTPMTPFTPGINPVELDANRQTYMNGECDVNSDEDTDSGHPLHDGVEAAMHEPIIDFRLARLGHIFAVITASSMAIWQTKPTAILAKVVRSASSLSTYGPNISVMVRPDSAIFVVQTSLGYLITYSLATNTEANVYTPHFPDNASVNVRRQSNFTGARNQRDRILWGPGEGGGVREVSVRFRMVIKVDAGICKALALDNEIIVSTRKPAAMQCIRWTPDSSGSQTSTELVRKMGWLPKDANIVDMVYDRPMNLYTWITDGGEAYAVQRISEAKKQPPTERLNDSETARRSSSSKKLFKGYCFHSPKEPGDAACLAAINARLSLISVGCADGSIKSYTARDYVGNIPISHTLQPPVSFATSGELKFLTYSPDGYCLFAGYEHGWATWSVFGKPGSTSFTANREISGSADDGWLLGVRAGAWLGNGSEILLTGTDDRIWVLELARSAVTGCFSAANLSRTMLQTTSSIMVYQGYDVPDLTSISAESSLWHVAEIPASYLVDNWPIKCSVISPDGRYIAVAGRRGLAHYSVSSGRWKTFVQSSMENEFQIRGGMCWHRHILVAAVEAGDAYGLQLYSREKNLDSSLVLFSERLPAPVVLITPSGHDSLLVYTQENLLYHFVFATSGNTVGLVQVGQMSFNGIVRSPARVRGLSWILPDDQIYSGDPSQDVAVATVVFLVDGKLVLLQPSLNQEQKLKYDMRIIAHNVEYYVLMRDQLNDETTPPISNGFNSPMPGELFNFGSTNGLRDSLWTFDGAELKLWTDVQEVLRSAPQELGRELPSTVSIQVDFYPLSILLGKGILLGVEPDLVQRRDVNFSFFRFAIRTHLLIPQVLRHYLSQYDSGAALHLAHHYRDLEYFAHALEMLLHNVLDEEVDTSPSADQALLPKVLSFLSSFPQYLDIVVQCTRKTEVRSWRTLFAYLPPPAELFEESLQRGSLKTAGGYLLVLHTFEELGASSEQLVRLLGRARDEGDWELCKELARFLTALDESGTTLKEALELVDLRSPPQERNGAGSFLFENTRLKVPRPRNGKSSSASRANGERRSRSTSGSRSPTSIGQKKENESADYFSVGTK